MALEIERKYAVNPSLLPGEYMTGPRIVQCYLTPSQGPEVRVRLAERLPGGLTEGTITIKLKDRGKVQGQPEIRKEYETTISSDDAAEIIKSGCGRVVRKMRSKRPIYLPIPKHLRSSNPQGGMNSYLNCTLEIDVYTDENRGLVIVELELPCAEFSVPLDCLPSWLNGAVEVTGLPQYSNRALADMPYTRWKITDRRAHQMLINAEVEQ